MKNPWSQHHLAPASVPSGYPLQTLHYVLRPGTFTGAGVRSKSIYTHPIMQTAPSRISGRGCLRIACCYDELLIIFKRLEAAFKELPGFIHIFLGCLHELVTMLGVGHLQHSVTVLV